MSVDEAIMSPKAPEDTFPLTLPCSVASVHGDRLKNSLVPEDSIFHTSLNTAIMLSSPLVVECSHGNNCLPALTPGPLRKLNEICVLLRDQCVDTHKTTKHSQEASELLPSLLTTSASEKEGFQEN